MSDAKVYVNGAFIPRHSVNGRAAERPFWRVGNLTLTEDALELTSKGERVLLPLASIAAVAVPPNSMVPPPVQFDQMLYLAHVENGQSVMTAIAFPRITVRNFPLQLAAMLTGTIRVFLPRGSNAAAGYEDAKLRFWLDQFQLQRVVGQQKIPLDVISNVQFTRLRDGQQREYVECTLDYVEGSSVRQMTFLTFDRLQFLPHLLGAVQGLRRNASLVRAQEAGAALGEMAQQVAVLLYTGGVTASSIEQMLAIKPDDVDKIYEDLLKLGLAEVVKVRKEIQLTPQGVKVVDDIMKKQLTATG